MAIGCGVQISTGLWQGGLTVLLFPVSVTELLGTGPLNRNQQQFCNFILKFVVIKIRISNLQIYET